MRLAYSHDRAGPDAARAQPDDAAAPAAPSARAALARAGDRAARWIAGAARLVALPGPWARVEGFERAALERALRRRTVVKALLMRATLHLVSARDLPGTSTRRARGADSVRARGRSVRQTRSSKALSSSHASSRVRAGRYRVARARARHRIRRRTGSGTRSPARGDASRTPPRRACGSRRTARRTTRRAAQIEAEAARRRSSSARYLAAFGPATSADISSGRR